MTTYYCWNSLIITYHDTWYNAYISWNGSSAGWHWEGLVSDNFHCLRDSQGGPMCNENWEEMEGHFGRCAGIGGVEYCNNVWPTIQEYEWRVYGAWVIIADGRTVQSG
jgi:hypothetical protein